MQAVFIQMQRRWGWKRFVLCEPLTASSLKVFFYSGHVVMVFMRCQAAGAYLLTYQLSVNTIQERRRDAPRDGESNEKSKGEEGRQAPIFRCDLPPSHTRLNLQKLSFPYLSPSSPHLLRTLRIPVCCCHDNLSVRLLLGCYPLQVWRKKKKKKKKQEKTRRRRREERSTETSLNWL